MTDCATPSELLVPFYAALEEWERLSGMTRSKTYAALGRGDLRAKKDGRRLLIDVRHGLAYLDGLPFADIKPKTGAQGIACDDVATAARREREQEPEDAGPI